MEKAEYSMSKDEEKLFKLMFEAIRNLNIRIKLQEKRISEINNIISELAEIVGYLTSIVDDVKKKQRFEWVWENKKGGDTDENAEDIS